MGVRILGEWERGEITMVMSASSGPKDYVKNLIAMAIESSPHIDRLRMLCGEYRTSVPFCVIQVKGRWLDITGKEVVFREIARPLSAGDTNPGGKVEQTVVGG